MEKAPPSVQITTKHLVEFKRLIIKESDPIFEIACLGEPVSDKLV